MERNLSKVDPVRNESSLPIDCLREIGESVNTVVGKENPMGLKSLLLDSSFVFRAMPELWGITERFFPQLASRLLEDMKVPQTNLLDVAERVYCRGRERGYDEGSSEMGTDCMTGLPGRRATECLLRELVAHDARSIPIDQMDDTIIGYILLADINGLKHVNDTLGHPEGDTLITKTANELKAALRATDLLGRTGGDEFVGYLPSKSNKLKPIIDRIVPILSKKPAAIGLVPITGKQADEACKESDSNSFFKTITLDADMHMYSAKTCGKNNGGISVLCYSPIPEHKRTKPRLRHRAIKFILGSPLEQEVENK